MPKFLLRICCKWISEGVPVFSAGTEAPGTPADLRRGGFSLIEVVLALGLVSFALLPMIGVLSVALGVSSSAGDDTALAAMSAQVLADLRAAPFDALGNPAPSQVALPATTLPATLTDSVYYFTSDGVLITATNAATSPVVLYKCDVSKVPDPGTQAPNGGIYNRVMLQLSFSWPPGQNFSRPAGQKCYYASISRY